MLFLVLLSTMATNAWSGTINETFDEWSTSVGEGWDLSTSATIGGYGYTFEVASDYKRGSSGKGIKANSSTAYLISPTVTGDVKFYYRGQSSKSSYTCKLYVYEWDEEKGTITGDALFSYNPGKGNATTTYTEATISLESSAKRLAFNLQNCWLDDFSGEEAPVGPVAVTGVTLNKTETTLIAGQNETLTATIAPARATNKNVTWASSDESVATVSSEGVVTAVAAGSATITVTTEDGKFTATCDVTVNAFVHVTSVALNKTETTIFVGDTETLTATVSPNDASNQNITWSSSDETVATVVDGTVTALKAGTTTITVTSEDGAKTATCAVTVQNVVVTGVTLDVTSATLIAGGTVTLTPTVAPSNATNKAVSWSTSNAEVATVSNGVVTAVAVGTATITVTTEDASQTATCTINVVPSLTVNDGAATNTYVPLYGTYADKVGRGNSQFIIPAADMEDMDGGTINQMIFYYDGTPTWSSNNNPVFNVYLKEVDYTVFDSKAFVDWEDEVFDGAIVLDGGKVTLTLNTPYNYNGGNLLVGFKEKTAGGYVTVNWLGKSTTTNCAVNNNSGATSYSYAKFLPKTTFAYTPGTPKAKMVVTPAAIDFGTISSTSTTEDKQKTLTISNNTDKANLTNIAVSCTGEGFAVTALPRNYINATGENSTDIELTVSFSGTTEKAYAGTITVKADDQTDAVVNLTATYADDPATMTVKEEGAAEPVGATVAFGEKGKQVSKTFEVSNDGDRTLYVTSIASDNTTDFTVSPSSLEVAGHSTETFTVTFVYGDGAVLDTEEKANITLQATGLSDVTFAVSGTRIEQWSEDFSGNALPAGWEMDGTQYWKFSDGVAHGKSVYGQNRTKALTTPKLLVERTTDVLTYKVKSTSTGVSVKIKYAKDGGDFTELKTTALENSMAEFMSQEITGLEAGVYQFQFMNDDYDLDDLEGFKLVPPAAHEAEVKTVTIPTTGNQYIEYTASVDVKVTGTNDERLTVKFKIGDTQYGSDVVKNVTSGSTETFEVTFTPTAAVSGEACFTIESNDIAQFESDKKTVTIAAATVLDETVGLDGLTTGTKASLLLNYTPSNGWNTIAVPFALTTDMMNTIYGTGWKAYEFKSYNEGALQFDNTTTFLAGYPYVVYVETAPVHAEGIKLTDVDVSTLSEQYDASNGAKFKANFTPKDVGDWKLEDKIYGITADGKIKAAGAKASMKAFRGFIDLSGVATSRPLSLWFDDMTTGIVSLENADEQEKAYNLQGQRVEKATKGLYIVGGRKVVRK